MNEQPTIEARVDSQLSLKMAHVPDRMRWSVAQRFTIKNPDIQKREALGLTTHNIPKRVPFYDMKMGPMGEELVLPRGAFTRIARIASREGLKLSIDGRNNVVTTATQSLTLDDFAVKLRDYQKEAVEVMLQKVQGFVCLPCGAGKTVLGGAAIALSGETSIVLVHTEDLATQWADILTGMYGLDVRIVGAGGGDIRWMKLNPNEVAVCMVQTLHANQMKAQNLLCSAGAVLMDECHHAPADSFRNLFRYVPARYRWGLTATPDRPDGWGPLLSMYIGPKLFEMTPAQLVEGGYLAMPKIIPISSGVGAPMNKWGANKRTQAVSSKAMNWLCDNKERTDLIVDLIMEAVEDERTSLVLVPRVKFAKRLAEMLRARGADAVAVTGQMNKSTRERSLQKLRNNRLQVIVATQLADEGLDVPNIDFLLNASAGRSAGRAVQRVGRAMRVAPGKRAPVVVEIVDNGGMYQRQWQARAFAYKQKLDADIPATTFVDDAITTLQKALE